MELPACLSRRNGGEKSHLFGCDHPRVHAARGLVARSVCQSCSYRREPPATAEAAKSNAGDLAGNALRAAARPEPQHARLAEWMERSVTDWAVGVTTAPRLKPTLERCLDSLAAAGWNAPRIFAEPGVALSDRYSNLPQTRRDARLGAFPNWYLGLAELYVRQPRAEAYFICQDDAIFSVGMREYMEGGLWPSERLGVVSAYTPSHWSSGKSAGFHVECRGWASWGALAYIFPNPSVRRLLADPLMVNHRHHGPADGFRNIDSVVGAWCESSGLPYYVHVPSLVQHIGDTSTIWAHASATGSRRAADFIERAPHETVQTRASSGKG